ncbi:MAG: YcxB family protein [Chloroflexota bacterium]
MAEGELDAAVVLVPYTVATRDWAMVAVRSAWRSRLFMAAGASLVVLSAYFFWLGSLMGWFELLMGLLLLTGSIGAIQVLVAVIRRPDLFGSAVSLQADERGLQSKTVHGAGEVGWSAYRSVSVERLGIFLGTGTGASMFIPRHAMTDVQRQRFVALARGAGLAEPSSTLGLAVTGLLAGALLGLVLIGIFKAMANGA